VEFSVAFDVSRCVEVDEVHPVGVGVWMSWWTGVSVSLSSLGGGRVNPSAKAPIGVVLVVVLEVCSRLCLLSWRFSMS